MVNKNIYVMQQPELGRHIQNWRKAKGLTQEELVEQCNLNVRTLQRIEAGEVSPRSYTIKSILAALEVDFSVVNLKNDDGARSPLMAMGEKHSSLLKWTVVIGIIYLCLIFVEGFMDYSFYENGKNEINGLAYVLVKIAVAIGFAVFYYPIYLLGKAMHHQLAKLSCFFLIGLLLLNNINDIIFFNFDYMSIELLLIAKCIIFGIAYLLIGVVFIQWRGSLGNLSLLAGIPAIITGIGFITVIFAIPALVSLTIFEVFWLVLIIQALNTKNYTANSGSDVGELSTAFS